MKIISSMADIEEGVAALCRMDQRLETIVQIVQKATPVPLRLSAPGFAGLAHIVVSQMVSRASAEAIWRRMVTATNEMTAENFLAIDSQTVSGFGLSRAKARTLQGVAEAVAKGRLDLATLSRTSPDLAFRELTALHGIGPWTAQVYLMFCEGHADIFPAGDVALQASVAHALRMEARPTGRQLVELSLLWSPWRSVAARIFWAYYGAINRRETLPTA